LDLNDAGFLTQQNAHRIVFETGWRELNRGPTRKIYTGIILDGTNSWDGVRRARQIDLQIQIDWKNVWSTKLDLDQFPTVFDDRESKDGARTEKAARYGVDLSLNTDRTRWLYAEMQGSVRTTWRGYSLSLSASLAFRPAGRFELLLSPTLDRVTGDPRWVQTTTDASGSKIYRYGLQNVVAPGVTLNTTFAFTPKITLQTYTQLFFASVRYGQLFEVTTAGSKPTLHLSDYTPASGNPSDFDTRDAVLNLKRGVSLGVFARLVSLPRLHAISRWRARRGAVRRRRAENSAAGARLWCARPRADRGRFPFEAVLLLRPLTARWKRVVRPKWTRWATGSRSVAPTQISFPRAMFRTPGWFGDC
jgi:hypothetical protein